MKIISLVFNHFLVNTYLLYVDNYDAMLVDPACSNEMEEDKLKDIIAQHKLNIKYILFTHTHIDHIAGSEFSKKNYPEAKLMMHHDAFPLYEHADNFCMVMGFNKQNLPNPDVFLEDNQIISLGGESIKVLHTPGHANGSICLYNEKNNFVLSGDVLFRQSIGRTDLPGGNYDWLIHSIQSKLFTLPQLTKVFPGHGDVSDIGFEMKNNPFL